MDDESGIVAVDDIIRRQPVPYLFVTGDVLRVKALRPDSVVIQKPFGESGLTLAIERALELRNKTRRALDDFISA